MNTCTELLHEKRHKIEKNTTNKHTQHKTKNNMNCLSASRWNIYHETQINAPISQVWAAIYDIDNWEWNLWTKLEASEASTGTCGKLLASYEGDGNYEEFDFKFKEVNPDTYTMNWYGSLLFGLLFTGDHVMRLEEGSEPNTTNLIHFENFTGLAPVLGEGLPYEKLDENYLLMNEALKEYAENENELSK